MDYLYSLFRKDSIIYYKNERVGSAELPTLILGRKEVNMRCAFHSSMIGIIMDSLES